MSASIGGSQVEDIGEGLHHSLEDLKDTVWELRESEARYRDLLDSAGQCHRPPRRRWPAYLCQQGLLPGIRLRSAGDRQALAPVVLEEDVARFVDGAPHQRYTQLSRPHSARAGSPSRPPSRARRPAETEIQLVGTDITGAAPFRPSLPPPAIRPRRRPGQVALPRRDEPRDPHADERYSRHDQTCSTRPSSAPSSAPTSSRSTSPRRTLRC